MKKLLIVLFLGSGFAMMGQTKILLSVAGEKVPYTPIPTGTSVQYIKGDHTIGDFSVSNTLNGSNLSTTVNGVTGNTVDIAGAIAGATSNTLTSDGTNTITSTVNNVAANVDVVNDVVNTLGGTYGTELITTVNGVAAQSVDLAAGSSISMMVNLQDSNLLKTTINGFSSNEIAMVTSVSNSLIGNNLNTVVNGVSGASLSLLPLLNNSWSVTGNDNTDPSINYIGTKDNKDVVFRRNTVVSGLLSTGSTSFGVSALLADTGRSSTAIGTFALQRNTTGTRNVAVGSTALFQNLGGSDNTAIGNNALSQNSGGNSNTGIGYKAMENNRSGDHNTAIGGASFGSNQTGSDNTVIGYGSLTTNEGGNNTVVGANSAISITGGVANTFIGANITGLPVTIANNIIIADGDGNRRINVNAAGNVGIGTNSATAKLEINNGGTASVPVTTPVIKIVDGSEGLNKVLTSDASGNAAWKATTVSNTLSGTNLTTTVNGVEGQPVNIAGAIQAITASNGLTATGSDIQLGGTLSKATTITTSGATNTLAITGLAAGAATDNLVVSSTGGVLKTLAISSISSSDWKTRGNAGTVAGTDFIGTTDDVDLVFKRFNIKSGVISATNTGFGRSTLVTGTGAGNTAFGALALSSLSGATADNTAVGSSALQSATTGGRNTAVGSKALTGITNATDNVGVGFEAFKGSNGSQNVAVGAYALSSTNGTGTQGSWNVALGFEALEANTTGTLNTSVGYRSLLLNTTGVDNTAVGGNVLNDNTTGTDNTVIGANSGDGITTGNFNTIIGANVTGLTPTLSNNIIIADGQGNRRINVDNSGNVGIGTANNATIGAKLEINRGAAAAGSVIKIVDGNEANGRVLTSNASGVATWQAIPAQSQPLKVIRFANTTATQTDFTLTAAQTGSYVAMYINGMRISNPNAVTILTSTTVRYVAGNNGGYILRALDEVVFEYM